MRSGSSRVGVKTLVFALIVIFSNAFGDLFLKIGMQQDTAKLTSAFSYIAVIFQPFVALGVVLLIVWMLSRMALLSWADLSFVLPVTALGYVAVAVLGRVFLNEHISAKHWAGILLIVAGVAIVGWKTPAATTPAPVPTLSPAPTVEGA
ncbi:MAG: EamA family transporter [Bryobacteraceae bacterium]